MMVKARRKLELGWIFKKYDNGEIFLTEMARMISDLLDKMEPLGHKKIDDLKTQLMWNFSSMAGHRKLTHEDFEEVMGRLYGWAEIHIEYDEVVCKIEID